MNKTKKKRSVFRIIVNTIIGIGLGLIILFFIVLGFSQTRTFREFLRGEVISIANSSINGKLNVSEIDGTIFTSLILRDVSIAERQDTLVYAKRIELNFNPFQLLLKKIYVKKLELENAKFNFLNDSTGSNLSRIFASEKKADTVSGGGFPFTIQVSNLNLINSSFRKTSLEKFTSEQSHAQIEPDNSNVEDTHPSVLERLYLSISQIFLIIFTFLLLISILDDKLKNIPKALKFSIYLISFFAIFFLVYSSGYRDKTGGYLEAEGHNGDQTFEAAEQTYDHFEPDDINLKNVNLSLSAFIELNEKNFAAEIKNLSANPNINGFYLRDLSGKFFLDSTVAEVDGLNIVTDNTDLKLSAKLEQFNLFNGFHIERLKENPVSVSLDAEKFYFDDLTRFVHSTYILKGSAAIEMEAYGKFGDLNIKNLEINLGRQTHIELTGNVRDLHTPKNMHIKANIDNSVIDDSDANNLLSPLELPDYGQVVLNKVKIKYDGHPTKFSAVINANMGEGKLEADSKFDFTGPSSLFDITLKTENFNLQPVLGLQTSLNANVYFKGEGFSPRTSNSTLRITAVNSLIAKSRIDSLKAGISIADKNIYANINASMKDFRTNLRGKIDFTDEEVPVYDINGYANNLNLAEILQDSSMNSDLNFEYSIQGESFNLDKLNSSITLAIENSRIRSYDIDSSLINVSAYIDENDNRTIELRSNYLDADISGKFNYNEAISLINYQAGVISKTIERKIYEFNPLALVSDSIKAKTKKYELENLDDEAVPEIASADLNIKYNLDIKDAGILAAFEDSSGVSIDGSISGRITNTPEKFTIFINVLGKYIRYVTANDLLYASDLNFGFNFSRKNSNMSFDDFKGKTHLSIGRIFDGSFIQNAKVNLSLDQNKSKFSVSASVDSNLTAALAGSLDMTTREYQFVADSLLFSYNGINWINSGKLAASYSKDFFNLKNFALRNDSSHIIAKGYIYSDGKEELTLDINNVPGSVITGYILNNTSAGLDADFNLKSKINGYLHAPVIDMDIDINNISYAGKNFGFLKSRFHYKNKSLDGKMVFLDSLSKEIIPSLEVVASIPIDLSFVGAKERLSSSRELIISVNAERFNLGALSNILPAVNFLGGKMTADININGPVSDINYTGNINISNASVIADANDLRYGITTDLKLDRQSLIIEDMTIENLDGLPNKGTMKGNGKIDFDGLEIKSINLKANGDLAVLAQKSRSVSPNVYGDLFIASNGDLTYRSSGGKSSISGNIVVKNSQLTFPPTIGGGSGNTENFKFRYKIDSSKISRDMIMLSEARKLAAERRRRAQARRANESASNFNYALNIKIEDEARIDFILSQELDQRLKALLGGELYLESKNGISNAQGEFTLQEGSTLSFFKTLEATGTIRFENDLANPRLNITAVYEDSYRDSIQVAVKIRLQGTLSTMGQELKNNPQNIAVYMGENNIQNNVADQTKTTTDALMFILTGNFQETATAAQQNMLASAATSLAGSVLGAYIASTPLKDYIKSVDVRTGSRGTQVSITGRVNKWKWAVGYTGDSGQSSQANQDFSNAATFKVEYLWSENFIIRVERKDPSTNTYGNTEKINELGIKYRFEF